jgi:hypothetical protein
MISNYRKLFNEYRKKISGIKDDIASDFDYEPTLGRNAFFYIWI